MKLWNKYRSLPVQAKASIWYTVCSFFHKGIAFIVVPIYVRLLSTAEYGQWAVFQSWASILIIFVSLNLYCGVYTKALVSITDSRKRDEYTSSMQGLGTITALLFFVVYLFSKDCVNKAIGLDSFLMLLLFLYFIVYPAFSFWSTRLRVEYRYKPMVAITTIMTVLTPLVSLMLLECTNLRANALILGFLSVQCFFGLYFYIIHFIRGKTFFNKDYWNYALKFNIPLIPHYLSLIVLGQSDRIMIKYYCGDSDAGIYSFAYQLASTINVLISAINGSRVPWTYEQLKRGTFNKLVNVANMLLIMMICVTLFISLISPEIIHLLGTSDYGVAVYVIPVVVLGVFFTFVYDLYASIEFYYGATKYVMYASVTGAILNIVLNAIFIPIYGFIAAAYTTLVCYIVFMLMHYLFSNKVLRKQCITAMVYNNKAIFTFSAFAGIICLCSMITFSYKSLRIALIAVLMGSCIIKKNSIKKLLLTLKK